MDNELEKMQEERTDRLVEQREKESLTRNLKNQSRRRMVQAIIKIVVAQISGILIGLIIVGISLITIVILFAAIDDDDTDSTDDTTDSDVTYIAEGDYCVDVTQDSSIKVETKEQLCNVIEGTYTNQGSTTQQRKANLESCAEEFIYIQNAYGVNALFAIAVTINESGGGTKWDLIDASTYNWMSIQGSYNGTNYTDRHGTSWRKYSSLQEATLDFGNWIGVSGSYFSAGLYTVMEIAARYDPPGDSWGADVIEYMTALITTARTLRIYC